MLMAATAAKQSKLLHGFIVRTSWLSCYIGALRNRAVSLM